MLTLSSKRLPVPTFSLGAWCQPIHPGGWFRRGDLLLATCFALLLASPPRLDAQDHWPQWRGARQQGEFQGTEFPAQWSEKQGVLWKLAIPGRGGSTPVIAGETAYLTSGIGGQNTLLAIELASGKIRWQRELGKDRGNKHKKGSGSNPSAIVDGDHVYAYFRSGDLACVSSVGETIWQINLQDEYGEDTLWWDLGSSPALAGDSIVIAVMQSDPSESYVVAFDKKTGKLNWKEDRSLGAPNEAAQSYTTPLSLNHRGKKLLAVLGADHLTLHDASTGKTLATLGGFNPEGEQFFRSISSPLAIDGYIACPYARGNTVTCAQIDKLLAGEGNAAVQWKRGDLGSDVPTPAARDGYLYIVDDGKQTRGKVSAVAIESGKTKWSVKIPKSRIGFTSSPLLAGDHLYVTAEDGTTHVIGPVSNPAPRLIASNKLDDNESFTTASPVPYQGSLLIRTKHSLYRIGTK